MRLPFALFCLAIGAGLGFGQNTQPETGFRVFRGDGTPATIEVLLAECARSEVTFVGEVHDDPTAHKLELSVLQGLPPSHLALAMEMFESDVQPVLDEYLNGLIDEDSFVKAARPWSNYKTDYRPLLEFARGHGLPVLATNAPRRYVNRVSRLGADSLPALSEWARSFLPPIPYPMASDAYATRFRKEMDDHDSPPSKPGNAKQDGKRPAAPPPLNMEHALQSQALWDATMAFSLADYLTRHPDSRIVQVNGSFHSSARLGTVEQLLHYRPQTRAIVVTIVPSAKPLQFKGSEMQKEGDFVVVTDEALIKAEPAPAAIKKEPTPAAARK